MASSGTHNSATSKDTEGAQHAQVAGVALATGFHTTPMVLNFAPSPMYQVVPVAPGPGMSNSVSEIKTKPESVYNMLKPGGIHVTNDDIAHFNKTGRYPARAITANIKFHVAVGTIRARKYGESDPFPYLFINPFRERISAQGITTLEQLLVKIDAQTWSRNLCCGQLFRPTPERVMIHVPFTLGTDLPGGKSNVRVDARGFKEWLDTEVACGRASFFDIDLIHNATGFEL